MAAGTTVAGDALVDLEEPVQRLSGHFAISTRSISRFAAIGIQELVPSLQGSRLAIEGVLQGMARLGGGFGTLLLAGTGLAALLGGYLYTRWGELFSGSIRATEGVRGLEAEITALDKKLTESVASLERWNKLGRGQETREVGGAFGLAGAVGPSRLAQLQDEVGLLRKEKELAEGLKLLEDPNVGPAGALAQKMLADTEVKFRELEKAVKAFASTSAEIAIDDPLDKLLIADWQKAQELLLKIREIMDPALEAQLSAVVGAAGGARQIQIRDAFSRAGGPAAAGMLGLGPSNLFAGFREITDLQTAVRGFSSEIERLARVGVPARDLFDTIGKAQEGLKQKVADLTTKFADEPAVLEKLRTAFGDLELGDLARNLDAVVRSDQGLKEGTLTLVDTAEGLSTTWIPKLKNAGIAVSDLANIMETKLASGVVVAHSAVVTLTGDVNDLAEAFRFAMTRAIGLATVIGSAVGGSTPSPLATE